MIVDIIDTIYNQDFLHRTSCFYYYFLEVRSADRSSLSCILILDASAYSDTRKRRKRDDDTDARLLNGYRPDLSENYSPYA